MPCTLTLQVVASDLGYSWELDCKTIMQKILHIWVTEHWQFNLMLSWKFYVLWAKFQKVGWCYACYLKKKSQLWTLSIRIMSGLAGQVHWCNSGMNLIGTANHFVVEFKFHSYVQQLHYWRQESEIRQITGPIGELTTIFKVFKNILLIHCEFHNIQPNSSPLLICPYLPLPFWTSFRKKSKTKSD